MCLVCGSNDHKATLFGGYAYSGRKYDIVRCRACGFMFLDPVPAAEVLDDIYKSDEYFSDYFIPGSDRLGYCEGAYERNAHHSRCLAALKRFREAGVLLDIGCAGGGFLIQAKNAGYGVAGVEPNNRMAAAARRATRAQVLEGNFKQGMFPAKSLDIVHLGDVLEHMPEPAAALCEISNILKDDGLLALEQPMTYNASLFNAFLSGQMLLKRNKYSDAAPAHLWEFNPATLRRFLEKNGFKVIWSEVYENKAKPLFVYKDATIKNRVARAIKNMSAGCSNSRLFRKAELGDRMLAICRKTSGLTKPRIAFVHPDLRVGGAETNRLNVLRYMDRRKYDITVCCLTQKGNIADQVEALGYRVDCLNVSDRAYDVRTTAALYRYFRKNRFTIVHTCLSNTNLHGRIAAKLAGVPVIIGEDQSEYERYNPSLGFIFKPLNRALAGFTDRIIVCSEKTGDVIARSERIPRDKFLTLHNVIDTESFRPRRSPDEVRRELGLAQTDIVIGYVASLAGRKGHTYLLQAFKMLSTVHANLKLVLVGDGPLKKSLEGWTVENGLEKKVIFTGQRMDVADILSIMTVFVSPALFEAFGIVLIEAMFMGLPCVAFRVGGIPEVIEDGRTGVLVTPGDTIALATAIQDLMDSPQKAQEYGRAGRARVTGRFSADTYARRLGSLYEELVRKRSYETVR